MYKKYNWLILIIAFLISSCDKKDLPKESPEKPKNNIETPSEVKEKQDYKLEGTSSLDDLKRDIANNSNISTNNAHGDFNNELINNNPFSTLNMVRNKIGLHSLYVNQKLNIAAEKHAQYLLSNDIASHEELPNMNNFYGQWPIDRAQNAGYTSGYEGQNIEFNIGEVLTLSQEDTSKSLDSLMRAIYHRFIMLEPSYNEIGLSSLTMGSKSTLSMLLGVKSPTGQLPEIKLSYYPYNNSYVPTSFRPEEEIPNPVPEKQMVGYPISVQLPLGYPLNITEFNMQEDNSGEKIEGKFLTSKNDPHVKDNQFAFIPWEPLKENQKYNINIKGNTKGATINFAWSFTTLTKEPFVVTTEKNVYKAGELLKINYKMSDGYKLDTNIRSNGTSKLLLDKVDNQPWGTLLYKVLPGCQLDNGCETVFTLTNDLNQQSQIKILIKN